MFPFNKIVIWWNNRKIQKIRDQYKYSLEAYANKHNTDNASDNIWLIIGLGAYVGTLIVSPLVGMSGDLSFYMSMGVLVFALFAPILAGFYEAYQLAKKLTLTLKVVPDNPEESRPFSLRLMGVEFGAPMKSKDELVTFLKNNHADLSMEFSTLEQLSEDVLKEAENIDMSVYPMMAKGDAVPSLTMFPDDPEKILRARVERVRLTYDWGKVRHATLYAFECKPVRTSIKALNKIIDVEYALFIPFFSQSDIDSIISKSRWHIPTRVQQEIATYVKQQADMTKNAAFFGTLEKQRDDAAAAYDRLVLHQQFTDIQKDVEGDVLSRFKAKKAYAEMGTMIIVFILGLVFGLLLPGFGG